MSFDNRAQTAFEGEAMRSILGIAAVAGFVGTLGLQSANAGARHYTLVVEPLDRDGKVVSHQEFKCAEDDDCRYKISIWIDGKAVEAWVGTFMADEKHLRVKVTSPAPGFSGPFANTFKDKLLEPGNEWVQELGKFDGPKFVVKAKIHFRLET